MDTGPVQESEHDELARLHMARHWPKKWLNPRPQQESQTFVARDNGSIVGLMVITYYNDGVKAYGIIHQLEVRKGAEFATVTRWLVKACCTWLEQLGTPCLYAMPEVLPARSLAGLLPPDFASGWSPNGPFGHTSQR